MESFTDKSILITGASAGIGEEFARQLAPKAKMLILVARRMDRLQELQTKLQKEYPHVLIHLRQIDLSIPDAEKPLVEWITQNNIGVDVLINNAGFGDIGTFHTSDSAKIRSMLMVNMVALTTLTHALLPQLIARQGGIINVASTAGSLPLPTFAVYAATKAYVCSFSEALRIELKDYPVAVTALCPGPVETEFSQVASRSNSKRDLAAPSFLYVSREEVVKEALEGLLRNQARVIPGFFVKLSIGLIELMPKPLLRFFLGLAKKSKK